MSQNISLHVLGETLEQAQEVRDFPTTKWPHSILHMGQNYAVLGQIVDLGIVRDDIPKKPTIPTHPLTKNVSISLAGDEGATTTRENGVGDELVLATADDLAQIEIDDEGDYRSQNPLDTNRINRAIKAYMSMLPEDTAVVVNHR